MFSKQAVRLLRTYWATAQLLAEELSCLFDEDVPLAHAAPITLTVQNQQAPLAVKGFTLGDSVISFGGGSGEDLGSLILTAGGLAYRDADGNLQVPAPRTNGNLSPAAGGTGGGFVGKVVSGSGSSYQVDLYENGPGNSATRRVSATQLQIDSAATIPAGTWALVAEVDRAFFIQVPVWLA